MKSIKLPYTPSITNESILEILQRKYPSNKTTKFFNQIRIKQNAMRVAQIVVIHNQRKNLTQISISATTPFWVGGTIIIPILFIILTSYSLLGNWATEITETLSHQLQSSPRKDKPMPPKVLETQKPVMEIPKPTTESIHQSKKVSFAKFSNFNTNS